MAVSGIILLGYVAAHMAGNLKVFLGKEYGLDRGEPRTLEEIGEHFHLTRESTRRIEAKAISKLRHPANSNAARSLLDA